MVCLDNIYASEKFFQLTCWRRIHASRLLILQLRRRLPLFPRSWTQCALDRLHASKVKPGADEDDNEIERAKRPKDAIVQPLIMIIDVEPGCKFVAIGVLTELTKTVAAILYVAAGLCNERGGV